MALTREEWHRRFQLQAQWTEGLRLYFFDLIKQDAIRAILDIGCGTGALLPDLQILSPGQVYGADLELEYLSLAKEVCPEGSLCGADVHHLPFADDSFDVVLCHFFLMWTGDPQHALLEMGRVAAPQGTVVAFAEPDYGGRIDHPEEFNHLRDFQIEGLSQAGADPMMGRKLRNLFLSSGFSDVEAGVYQGFFPHKLSREELESEWQVLEEDLSGILPGRDLQNLKEQDLSACEKGLRLIYVPTFYAWGKVK